jgi:hypothetical protein
VGPFLALAHLLQRASELAAVLAGSPSCLLAMDLGPWRQESRRAPSSPWAHLLQRASDLAAVRAGSPSCLLALDRGSGRQESPRVPSSPWTHKPSL